MTEKMHEKTYRGIMASPGIVIGRAYLLDLSDSSCVLLVEPQLLGLELKRDSIEIYEVPNIDLPIITKCC